jgi:hypothetical protein
MPEITKGPASCSSMRKQMIQMSSTRHRAIPFPHESWYHVLFGHVHVFECIAQAFNNASDPNELNNPKFPWYIVNGPAG